MDDAKNFLRHFWQLWGSDKSVSSTSPNVSLTEFGDNRNYTAFIIETSVPALYNLSVNHPIKNAHLQIAYWIAVFNLYLATRQYFSSLFNVVDF
jgi:hypothetical protein